MVESCSEANSRASICRETVQKITINGNTFERNNAECKINNYQSCVLQTDKASCEDPDLDCKWMEYRYSGKDIIKQCVPKYPPAGNYYDKSAGEDLCDFGNSLDVIYYVDKEDGSEDCDDGCYLEDDYDPSNWSDRHYDWLVDSMERCYSLGDCGPKPNFIEANNGFVWVNANAPLERIHVEDPEKVGENIPPLKTES
jgi:hypothetical protein